MLITDLKIRFRPNLVWLTYRYINYKVIVEASSVCMIVVQIHIPRCGNADDLRVRVPVRESYVAFNIVNRSATAELSSHWY